MMRAVEVAAIASFPILAAAQHARHHAPPFDRNYCTAAGWLNGLLNALLRRTAT